MTDQAIVGGEERARECLAKRYEQAGRFDSAQHIRDGLGADLSLITDAMLTFAAEASGIGVPEGSFVEQFRKAVGEDAWLSIPTYLQNWITAKALATHIAASISSREAE